MTERQVEVAIIGADTTGMTAYRSALEQTLKVGSPVAEPIGHLLAWSMQRALQMGPPPVERCLNCGPGA